MRTRTWRWLPLLAGALLAGCAEDDETATLFEPVGGADFMERYVSVGNSLTAGMQSGGINDSLQAVAYPVLVAAQAGVTFNVPLLRSPGCPPPYLAPVLLDTTRLGMAQGAPACSLRGEAVAPRAVHNVAYPGSYVGSAVSNAVPAVPGSDVFKTLILGGRTQLQAMADARPTFVSVWLGNNETLAGALAADPNNAAFVPQAAFEASLDSIVRAIRSTPARERALLISPVNALALTPLVQPGVFLWALSQDPAGQMLLQRLGRTVNANCAPSAFGGRGDLVMVSLRAVTQLPAQLSDISCADNFPAVMGPAEIALYTQRVTAYKEAVRTRAEQNGWAYLDPEAAIAADLADPTKFRKCQALRTATPQTFAQAVQSSCPSPSSPAALFGSWISFDGVHPTAPAHRAFANAVINAINQEYGSTIPTL